ncbi:O-antigen ligase family protein [Candidatus Thiothrix sp. Deng01]|uniref:O-antigen ligase family protein n=1 Tax=Candidatus Thiothrix phosphatis TaxID=3112415 RepID=A0ABU6CVR7_9GAMM|nr:O-antigen ligase family protein [Candidatus Thiothrix sp. Deng01]MEB4590148.1 O-antigen ligase family protein [Candidatus Thiothrix sp. Deng01]
MNTLRNIAIFFLMMLVFALPTDGAVDVAGMSLVKIAGLMAFGLMFVLIVMGAELSAVPALHIPVLLYVAWVILSYTWSAMPIPYESEEAVGGYQQAIKGNLYVLMITLLLFQLAKTEKHLQMLYLAFILGDLWLVYLMVKDYQIGGNTVRQEIKDFDANEVAVKLAMAMPLAIYLFTVARHWVLRGVAVLYLPMAMFTILITGSRTGAVTMMLGLTGLWPLVKNSGVMGKAIAGVTLISVLVIAANVIPQQTIERIFSTGKEISEGTLNERSVIWGYAYEEWKHSPVVGHGLSSFRRVINQYNVKYTAHNSFVSIAAEQGIIGVLLYGSVIVASFVYAFSLPPLERLLMLSMLGIIFLGQMSLTIHDRMQVWFAYSLPVLISTIKNSSSKLIKK